jgi:hypothetical protein
LDQVKISFSREQVENVNSESLNILSFLNHNFLNSLKSLFPVSILYVNLGFLDESRIEGLIAYAYLTKNFECDIVFLLFLIYLSSTKHSFQILMITTLLFIEYLLEEC